MRLFAALVPPQDAIAELYRTVGAVSDPDGGDPAHQLRLLPPYQVMVPISAFGNVTIGDARALADLLATEALQWPSPSLRISGAQALAWSGDRWVWSELQGDTDGMNRVIQGVIKSAQRLRIFVDRRRFQPLVPLGEITDHTTADYLEALVTELERWRSPMWTHAEVTLLQGTPPDGHSEETPQVFSRIPLGPATPPKIDGGAHRAY